MPKGDTRPVIKIAPSILSADFSRLGEEVARVQEAGADYLHIDVMDGRFVPNITIGPLVVAALRPHSSLVFDVHLMIEDPDRYVADFIRAGADIVTVHVEAVRHLDRTLRLVRERGARCGVALNPATPVGTLEYVLPLLDQIMVMTVNPGFGGQGLIGEVVPKITRLRRQLAERNLEADIEVDGGINPGNIRRVVDAGANVLVAGSAVFGAADPAAAVRELRNAANESEFFNKSN